MIEGIKKVYGVIGYPLDRCVLPAMYNAAFKEAGLADEYEYRLFELKPEGLDYFFGHLDKQTNSRHRHCKPRRRQL